MNQTLRIGPWLLSATTNSSAVSSIILARNIKRYSKFEVVIDTELADLSVLNFLLLIEVAISEPSNPVITTTTQNILKRFPSWMSLYQDSLDDATPNLHIPKSTAGKFVNAIIGENLDNFKYEVELQRLNNFIETSDESQHAWIYSAGNIPNTFNKVIGNNVELARVDNLVDFYKSKQDDYVFYHNPVNREIITLKKYKSLLYRSENLGDTHVTQIPIQAFNWFDEFGARVGLSRLYLESNTSFRARIIDVFKNPNGADLDSFKKVLRRELNLWKAFGATPSFDYPGATPEILEISDIEYSTPYFTADGNPTELFAKLVQDFNTKYPNNWGYFKFGDSMWDYAGLEQEGINKLHSRYYDDSLPLPYYQPGVGDLADGKLTINTGDATPVYFTTTITATGKKKTGVSLNYQPIVFDYQYYGSYDMVEYENPHATVNFTLEFHATPHGSYSTPTILYTPLTLYPKNNFGPLNSASPEFQSVDIFDTEGYVSSSYKLINKNDLRTYVNSVNNIANTRLDIKNVNNIVLKNGLWNGSIYATPNSNNFVAKFSHRNSTLANSGSLLSATPNFTQSTKLQVASSLYKQVINKYNTPAQKSSIEINNVATPPGVYTIDQSRIISNILFPIGATPTYIHLENIPPVDADGMVGSPVYGGKAYYSETDREIYVPSSPNIKLSFYGSNLSTPVSTSKIGSTVTSSSRATANYYFTEMYYKYNSTPNLLTVQTVDSESYPFKMINWEKFTATSSTPLQGSIDENGIVNYNYKQGEYTPGKNSDSILVPELTRESFGISGATKFDYFFETIDVNDPADLNVSIWSEQKIVNPFLNRTFVLENTNIANIIDVAKYQIKSLRYPSNSIVESFSVSKNTTVFSNFLVKGKLYSSELDTRIHTGWIQLSKNSHYIYAEPKTETFQGRLKTINLSGVPRQGAPVIIDVYSNGSTPVQYTEVAFPDEATPRDFGFYNTEILQPRFDNSFYLGYENTYNLSISDGLTGELLFSNLSATPSFVKLPTSEYSFIKGRDYSIRYKVRNSYYLDNILNGSDYRSVVTFDATPSATMNYQVTYESSIYQDSTPVNLDFGQVSSVLEDGYVIVTDKKYAFDKVKIIASPSYLLDDKEDFVTLSLLSLDINGNPKPYQTFDLSYSSSVLSAGSNRLTTNAEGFAKTEITYSGANRIQAITSSRVTITGVNHSVHSYAHPNSESGSYSGFVDIDIYSSFKRLANISAVANPNRINADGVSSLYVNGLISDKSGAPLSNKVIYWKKSSEMYSVLQSVSYSTSEATPGYSRVSGIVRSDQNGKFQIGPVVAQNRATPGYWFMTLESELAATPSANPSIMAGDTIYWYEAYDNIDYNYDPNLKIPNVITYDLNKSLDLYSTPSFLVSYYNEDIAVSTQSTPRWTPPIWLSVPRYEQYQAGYLGATPYSVSKYTNLKNDSKD